MCVPQAYSAAVQTQWQWIKQLCLCVEQHVKENAAYFQVLGSDGPNFLVTVSWMSFICCWSLQGRGKEGFVVLIGAAFS